MNRYILFLVSLLVLSVSCGKSSDESTDKKKNTSGTAVISESPTEENVTSDNSETVDPDEFSKAFSKGPVIEETPKNEPLSDDGSRYFKKGHLAENRFENSEFLENTPPKASLADKVGGEEKYSWLPNWDYSGKGGVHLPAAAISSDKSLLALLENVPSGREGVKSTLLVLINTYNWNINAIYYYPGKLFSKIEFQKETPSVIVWEAPQKESKEGFLHSVNLRNGEIIASSTPVKAASVDFAIRGEGGDEMILKTGNKKSTLYVFNRESLDKTPQTVKCDQAEGRIAVPPDNTLFAFAGKDKIELFKFSDYLKLKDIPLNIKDTPECFIFAGDNKTFALMSYMKPCSLISDNVSTELCEMSGRAIFYNAPMHNLCYEEYKNRTIKILDMQTMETVGEFSPEKIKPKTLGNALLADYLPHLQKYMIMDMNGNLSLFYKPGKRWRKRLIFSPIKK